MTFRGMQPLQHIAILLKVMSQNKSYTDMKRHDGVRKRVYKYTKEGGMYCNAMPLAVSLGCNPNAKDKIGSVI